MFASDSQFMFAVYIHTHSTLIYVICMRENVCFVYVFVCLYLTPYHRLAAAGPGVFTSPSEKIILEDALLE